MAEGMLRKLMVRVAALGIVAGAMAIPASAQAPTAPLLNKLTRGAWTLRIRDTGEERRICIRNGSDLVQIQHEQPGCTSFIVNGDANSAVVQYTCRGNGYGRTSIRQENKELVQVQSQGIYRDTPFSFSAEARYAGRC